MLVGTPSSVPAVIVSRGFLQSGGQTDIFQPSPANFVSVRSKAHLVRTIHHTEPTDRPPPNFGQVVPGLFRGAQPSPANIEFLKSKGVNTIIDLRDHGSDQETLNNDPSFNYVHIPCHTIPAPKAQVLQFLHTVTTTTDAEHPPVFYVHCEYGKDRTGLMIAAYRVVIQGWSKEAALQELKSYGFHRDLIDISHCIDTLNPEELRQDLAHYSIPAEQPTAPQ